MSGTLQAHSSRKYLSTLISGLLSVVAQCLLGEMKSLRTLLEVTYQQGVESGSEPKPICFQGGSSPEVLPNQLPMSVELRPVLRAQLLANVTLVCSTPTTLLPSALGPGPTKKQMSVPASAPHSELYPRTWVWGPRWGNKAGMEVDFQHRLGAEGPGPSRGKLLMAPPSPPQGELGAL